MRYVRLEREGVPVWGVVQGENVRTLTGAPYAGICYDGHTLPLSACKLLAPARPRKSSAWARTTMTTPWRWGKGCPSGPFSS